MSISAAFLPEFDHETQTTRQCLERLPEAHLQWKPHPKSMSLGRLASHLAETPTWGISIVTERSFDLAPPGAPPHQSVELKSKAEILGAFNENSRALRAAFANLPDAAWMESYSLLKGGQALITMPRVAFFRTWVLSHSVHHRGQLSVYLRLKDVPVPMIYGPTADEGGM